MSDLVTAYSIAFGISFAMIIMMKITLFIICFLIIRLGYRLLCDGIKGEFTLSAKLSGAQADLASVSPGLLFVLLGIALAGYAIQVDKGVDFDLPSEQELTSLEAPSFKAPPTSLDPFAASAESETEDSPCPE